MDTASHRPRPADFAGRSLPIMGNISMHVADFVAVLGAAAAAHGRRKL
jgi:hypothetical protein